MSDSKHQRAVDLSRQAVHRLKDEIRETETLPTAGADTRAGIREHLERVAADRARGLQYAVTNFVSGEAASPLTVKANAGGIVDLTHTLVALLGVDAVAAGLCRHLPEHADGISETDRSARLDQLRAQLLAAEHKEQDRIDAARADGVWIPYRADANPAVVLRG